MSAALTAPQSSDTPILDRLAPVPAPVAARSHASGLQKALVATFLSLPVLWMIAMVWSPTLREGTSLVMTPFERLLHWITEPLVSDDLTLPTLGFALSVAPLAIFGVIVVHELGHLIAGWTVGFHFLSIRFGPVKVEAPFRVSFQRSEGTGASGWTSMAPRTVRGIRVRLFIMILAGPIANLLSGFVVVILFSKASIFTAWFALMSILVGLANLVPFHHRSLVSDGKRLLMLLRGGGQGERWIAIVQLGADLRNGVAPEELRPDLLAMATALRDHSIDTVAGHALAYAAAWYRQTPDEAARLLEVCLEHLGSAPPIAREVIFSDAGVFQGRKRNRQDLAREWLSQLPEKTRYPGLKHRVEAAILEAEGDLEGSLRKLDEVEQATKTLPDRQQRAVSLKMLQRWRFELTQKLRMPLPAATSSP